MFKACFVARVDPLRTECQTFCQFRNDALGTTIALPSAQHLGSFCFPLGPENVKAQEYAAPEEYSFTLTGGDGSHLHGFCRTFLPPRAKRAAPGKNLSLRFPQVLCIISPFAWFLFYFKILQIVEALLKQDDLLVTCSESILPTGSPAAVFMRSVLEECKGKAQLGRILRIAVPSGGARLNISPQRRIHGVEPTSDQPLQSNEKFIDLQIPPDTGNGSWNAGTPLGRLFWHLPSGSLLALMQAILLERRVLMVAQERDTLSAAVHALAALLYPFRWQHIFLPLLPHILKDYLTAPMPYLIGVPAPQMLAGLHALALEDIVYVDLDAGSCLAGGPDGPPLDFALLPWSHQLQAAFQIVYQMLRSPTEVESTQLIGHCLQEYFLKLLGSYREHIEIDEPVPEAEGGADGHAPGSRHQDDGYLRAHGYRFDHLSFVANQRRSEKARNFLDMLRHSQMYEVFINERLALAAGGFSSSDAFEAKVAYLQGRRTKILGRMVAQASAKGVSNLSAVLQRTSTLVKSGVSHIRHVHSSFDDQAMADPHPHAAATIVPSYSIDVDSPTLAAPTEGPPPLQPPVPSHKLGLRLQRLLSIAGFEEAPPSFFNHDIDAEEDVPPEPQASRPISPARRTVLTPPAPLTLLPGSNRSLQTANSLSSPRCTGITSGGEGFDALLNLDGVEGVFRGGQAQAGGEAAAAAAAARTSINSSLLDEDGPAGQSSSAFDLSGWGLGLPTVSEAASSVAEWASSIQALAMSFNGSEPRSAEPSPASSSLPAARQPSYDLNNAASLGTIDPFQEFHSPEAVRASSCTRPAALSPPDPAADAGGPPTLTPTPSAVLAQGDRPQPGQKKASFRDLAAGGPVAQRTTSGASQEAFATDPFSKLDPFARRAAAPMAAARGGRPADDVHLAGKSAATRQAGAPERGPAASARPGESRQELDAAASRGRKFESSRELQDTEFADTRSSLLDM